MFRNTRPMLVDTLLLYGGLRQMMLRFRFLGGLLSLILLSYLTLDIEHIIENHSRKISESYIEKSAEALLLLLSYHRRLRMILRSGRVSHSWCMCVVVMAMVGGMGAGMEVVLGKHAGQSQVVGRMCSSGCLTRDAKRRLRFVVHAACWLHSMVLHGCAQKRRVTAKRKTNAH